MDALQRPRKPAIMPFVMLSGIEVLRPKRAVPELVHPQFVRAGAVLGPALGQVFLDRLESQAEYCTTNTVVSQAAS
ncbi:hypothetical protein [Nonomuraea sp. NPDC049695]|uniref:hypothetical protein n=1 Tax=Nonomuraea sp. NPDC049695 TaxID=3154734 RepID=UPI003415E1F4